MKRIFIFSTVLAYLLISEIAITAIDAETTQGQFAVRLAEKLGLGKDLNEEKAVELLSSLSIRPGIQKSDKWEKDKPATDKFVAYIQASIQMILKNLCNDLDIPPPPTLNLYIFELPPAPQSIYFKASEPPADKPLKKPSATQTVPPSGPQELPFVSPSPLNSSEKPIQ